MNNSKKTKFIRLDHYGIVSVSGADAESFLQRQFTNDISKITPELSSFSSYLNPKGRIIANFIIFQKDEAYFLIMSGDLVEPFVKRLRMFVMRDKVNVSDKSELCVVGTLDDDQFESESILPADDFQVINESEVSFIRLPSERRRTIIVGCSSELKRYESVFDSDLIDDWMNADIDSMQPLVDKSTTEELLLQATNLDLIGAVSFTKGCYPGQEIVARLHYKGGVNRRLARAYADGVESTPPGTSVFCDDLPGNQSGLVVNSAKGSDSKSHNLLISIPLKFWNQENLRTEDGRQVNLQTEQMPYAIPELTGK